MQLQARIQKWGNGLGLRISGILRDLPQFQVNDTLEVEVTDQGFSVMKAMPQTVKRLRYSEAQLLAGINSKKIHKGALAKPLKNEWR